MAGSDASSLSPVPAPGTLAPAGGPVEPADELPAGRLQWMPILFISLFAGLLASFPARNSDFLLHLAEGRELTRGRDSFGRAVFLSAENPRANHTWLYDLLSYGLYS